MRPWFLALAFLGGCAKSVMPLYEAAKADALRDPGPPPAGWTADAWIQIASPTLDHLLEAILQQNATLSATFDAGLVQLSPELVVSHLDVLPPAGCQECLTVDVDLTGNLGIDSPLGHTSTSLTATGRFDSVFEVVQTVDGWEVDARPKKLRNIAVSLGASRYGVPLGAISDWITQNLLAEVPGIPLTQIPAQDLPLRAVRVLPVGKAVRVEVLTRAPDPVPAPIAPARLEDGWMVGISQGSLLAAARAQAFRQGPVAYGVVPEPTALDIAAGTFTLGLRLWRIEGRGWWRDYTVLGKVALQGDSIDLTANQVIEGPKSPGAVIADPLAALAEGKILDALENALEITLPTAQNAQVAGLRTELVLQELAPEGAGLRASGTLDATAAPNPRPRRRGPR
jgi:hypothetical protein